MSKTNSVCVKKIDDTKVPFDCGKIDQSFDVYVPYDVDLTWDDGCYGTDALSFNDAPKKLHVTAYTNGMISVEIGEQAMGEYASYYFDVNDHSIWLDVTQVGASLPEKNEWNDEDLILQRMSHLPGEQTLFCATPDKSQHCVSTCHFQIGEYKLNAAFFFCYQRAINDADLNPEFTAGQEEIIQIFFDGVAEAFSAEFSEE